MMTGTGEDFDYLECSRCQSLTLVNPPRSLSEYYSGCYYSFAQTPAVGIRGYFKGQRLRYILGSGGLVGALVYRAFGKPYRSQWMHLTSLDVETRILDVGCGSGALLRELQAAGYRNLTGIDPFLREEIREPSLRIIRSDLSSWEETHDFVMMHHSFEHMPDPRETMACIARVLTPQGRALVRAPAAGTFGWREYGANWVQLDAPRHLFIPSVCGMERLAEASGLEIERVEFDSTEFLFWGSELYRKGIPLKSADPSRHFTRRELAAYSRKAEELNRKRDGDAVCFLLKKP